jgi:hypothetical protein
MEANMSLMNFIANTFGFQDTECDSTGACDVTIEDGKVVGNPYHQFGADRTILNREQLGYAYEKISCVGGSIDLISNNMEMIEPVFWDEQSRETLEYLTDKKLRALRNLFEKPNAVDNRKTLISKSVKAYCLMGVIYYLFYLDKSNDIISLKVVDDCNVVPTVDLTNQRISSYSIQNNGAFSGEYIFDGSYYTNSSNKYMVLAPYVNSSAMTQYLPASPLQSCGVEALMYWFGCYHNKSLLQNGARPSIIFMIKSMLTGKHREQLRSEIRLRHSGAGNAGNAMILDGAADKEIKQLSQSNKDMEFGTVLEAAESAIYKRLGTNWILDKKINSKDFPKGMEMLYDMTICPLFQGIFNHIFDVYKKYNNDYSKYRIFYLEQDVPALRPRFLAMMKDIPSLGIFTIKERRKMYNYKPLGDERDDELSVQTVKVTQTGNSGVNNTDFSQ